MEVLNLSKINMEKIFYKKNKLKKRLNQMPGIFIILNKIIHHYKGAHLQKNKATS
jgi:hypothetical protein